MEVFKEDIVQNDPGTGFLWGAKYRHLSFALGSEGVGKPGEEKLVSI
jgi:hypothetical protein